MGHGANDVPLIEQEFIDLQKRCATNALVKAAGGLVLGGLCSALFLKRRKWPIFLAMGFGLGSAYGSCDKELRAFPGN